MTNWGANFKFQKNYSGKNQIYEKTIKDTFKNSNGKTQRKKNGNQAFINEDRHKLKTQIYSKQNALNQLDRTLNKYDGFNHDATKDFTSASFGEKNKLVDINMNTHHKRQNGRMMAFELKVNNIDCIHDKIVNLLNMVNKDVRQAQEKDYKQKPKQNCNSKQQYIAKIVEEKHKQFQRPKMIPHMDSIQRKRQITYSREDQTYYKHLKDDDEYEIDNSYGNDYHYLQLKKHEQQTSSKKLINQDQQDQQNQQDLQDASTIFFSRNYKLSQGKNMELAIERKQKGKNIGKIIKEKRKDQNNQRIHEDQNQDFIKEPLAMVGKWKNKYQRSNSPVSTIYSQYERTPQKRQIIQQTQMPRRCGTLYERITSTDAQSKKNNKIKIMESGNQPYIQSMLILNGQQKNIGQKERGNQQINHISKLQLKVLSVRIEKEQTVRIAERLSNQVEIDSRMKRAREQFDLVQNQDKWSQLQTDLHSQGINLSLSEIKELIKCSPDEYNPFCSQLPPASQKECGLADLFCQAQWYWERQVCACASLQVLKTEGFQVSNLDLNKKGHLQAQDLGSFINLYTGRFYRNRDIALIYRRLQLLQNSKNRTGVSYSTFLRILTT